MKHYVFLRRLGKHCSWGGFEKQLMDCFERVDYSQTKITLLVNVDIYSERIAQKELSVKVKLFPSTDPENPYRPLEDYYQFLVSLKADVVVLAQGSFMDFVLSDYWACFLASRGRLYSMEVLGSPEVPARTSKKYLGVIPGMGLWWYRHMLICGLKGWLCRANICIGNDVRDRLIKWYGYPKHKTLTVYHGVDLNNFQADATTRNKLRKQWGIADNEKVIITTSRLSQEKCIDRLIHAFGRIDQTTPSRLFIVGDGPLRQDLESLAQQNPNVRHIKFLGFQDDIPSLLKMSDIFVLSSDIEGLSNSMVEAMAVGLVVIVTDVPGASELIQDSVNGFIVEKEVDRLAQGLQKVISLSSRAALIISAKARECIQERFNIESGTRETLRVISIPRLST